MIKIAFATETPNGLDGIVAQHFGCCPYYTFVDGEKGEVRDWLVVQNPAVDEHSPGQIPQFAAGQGAHIIVAGGTGPWAQEWFIKPGVKPYIRVSGKVNDVLSLILKGELKPIDTPDKECDKTEGDCGNDHHHH